MFKTILTAAIFAAFAMPALAGTVPNTTATDFRKPIAVGCQWMIDADGRYWVIANCNVGGPDKPQVVKKKDKVE